MKISDEQFKELSTGIAKFKTDVKTQMDNLNQRTKILGIAIAGLALIVFVLADKIYR